MKMENKMKNLKRSIVALLLVIVLFASSIVPSFAVGSSGQPSTYSKQYNSGTRDVVCTTLNGTSASTYYTGSYTYDRLDDLSASTLKTTLKSLMKSTHKYTSSYNDCHYKADRTDCENENKKVVLIYTSYSATMSQWDGWNREHVWPKSLGGNNTTGGGADLHHIRPSDAGVNSSRGNKKYGEAGNNASEKKGTNPATGVLGGYYNSTYFEPLDNVKGDVARICLYVYVRWGSEWGADSITEVFQSVDILLEWCALDPVDTWEMGRNEVIQNIQGNRNVFIDYPELAWLLFDREIPDDMVTPSGMAMSGNNGGSTDDPVDPPVDEDCTHPTTEVRGKIEPTCGNVGYTGDTYCKTCGEKLKSGKTTAATGEHKWSGFIVTVMPTATTPGEKVRTCSECRDEDVEIIPALGQDSTPCTHSSTEIRGKIDATCGNVGYTGDTYCKNCDEKLTSGTSTPATGEHTWSDFIIITEPSTDHDGEKYRYCEECREEEHVSIPALDDPIDDPVDPPVDDPTDDPVDPPVDDPTDDPADEEIPVAEAIITALTFEAFYHLIFGYLARS